VSATPDLSVVISTLGNYDVLRRVLDGYSRQDAPAGSFEVLVVVDHADQDPDAVRAAIGERSYATRMLRGERPGLSANRNAGWRAAGSPLVLFTDNDTIPVRRFVSEHLAWHRDHPADEVAVAGHVRWARELNVTPFMRWLDRGIQFNYSSIEGIEAGWAALYGANTSLKREFVARVGGFDEERFPYLYDDLDFAWRAREHGLRVLYNRRAVVDHVRPGMTLDFWKQKVRRLAAAERQFTRVHPDFRPWFHGKFSNAAARPPARGRGVRLARFVPPGVPWLGPLVWTSADIYFRQALAPHFLEAWEEAASGPPSVAWLAASSDGGAARQSARAGASAGSQPGGS
jgi:GT2 family glycosyltransferase